MQHLWLIPAFPLLGFLVNGLFNGGVLAAPKIEATFSATYADGSVLRGTFSLGPG